MKAKSTLVGIISVLIISTAAFSQQSNQEPILAPNAPKDKLVETKGSEVQQLEAALS